VLQSAKKIKCNDEPSWLYLIHGAHQSSNRAFFVVYLPVKFKNIVFSMDQSFVRSELLRNVHQRELGKENW